MPRLEQLEYERVSDELTPIIDEKLRGVAQVLPPTQAMLVVLGVAIKQAARVAQRLGMTQADFEKHCGMVATSAFGPRRILLPAGFIPSGK